MPAIETESNERLFIGVPVPPAARMSLMRRLPPSLPGRPAPPENWHFTLRFLGSTDPARRDSLAQLLRNTPFGPEFNIEFDQLGAFPGARRARVLWVGVGAGRERLESVAEKAEAAARAAGFDAEPRRFTAHLTISRMKRPESVVEFLTKPQRLEVVMKVSEVILYRSEPGGQHSRYTVVDSFQLR